MRVIVAWIACGKNVQDPGDVSRSEATVPGKQADGSRAPQQSRQNCRFKSRSPQKLPNGILQREAPRILGGTFGNKSRTPRKTQESWKQFKKRQGTQAATCSWSSQKSILRDAVMDLLSMDFYAKLVLCVMFPQGQIHVCIVCVCVCSCVLLSLQASAIDIAELDISVQSALA
jgi:hypothetical protein